MLTPSFALHSEDQLEAVYNIMKCTCGVLQEVVSLGGPMVHPAELARSAAPHVCPADFHQLLQEAQQGQSDKETVLLDTRNIYETRIGHFLVVRPLHVF
jgi:predicted sulfurtransferase